MAEKLKILDPFNLRELGMNSSGEQGTVDLRFHKRPNIAWRLQFKDSCLLLLPVETLAPPVLKDRTITGELSLKSSSTNKVTYVGFLSQYPVEVLIVLEPENRAILARANVMLLDPENELPLHETICLIMRRCLGTTVHGIPCKHLGSFFGYCHHHARAGEKSGNALEEFRRPSTWLERLFEMLHISSPHSSPQSSSSSSLHN